MRAVAKTDVGCERDTNEDRVLALPDLGLVMVADGMGGQAKGEVASQMAVDIISSILSQQLADGRREDRQVPALLVDAVARAHEQIVSRAAGDAEMKGMGTTVVLALEQNGNLHIAHVGDSRAYLFQGGTLRQLTRDHSLVAEMISAGEITAKQARTHRLRNYLTRNLGNTDALQVDVQTVPWDAPDCLLLCSDGLASMVADKKIEKLLSRCGPDLERVCRELIDLANSKGGTDNISVIVACPQ
jgi:protein phosphatase